MGIRDDLNDNSFSGLTIPLNLQAALYYYDSLEDLFFLYPQLTIFLLNRVGEREEEGGGEEGKGRNENGE
jgi:hypothetical protein